MMLAPSGDRVVPATLYCLIRVQVKLTAMAQYVEATLLVQSVGGYQVTRGGCHGQRFCIYL